MMRSDDNSAILGNILIPSTFLSKGYQSEIQPNI